MGAEHHKTSQDWEKVIRILKDWEEVIRLVLEQASLPKQAIGSTTAQEDKAIFIQQLHHQFILIRRPE